MSLIERKAREVSRPTLEAIGRGLARTPLTPDFITLLGLALTAGVAALAAVGQIRWAGIAYIAAALFDSLDGALARARGGGSRFGAFLDSSVDRVEEGLVFLGLTIHYVLAGSAWEPPLILFATLMSLMVSYTRARAEGLGVACKDGLMTRLVRLVVLIAGMILGQVLIAVILIGAGSLVTSIHRVIHVRQMTGGEKGGWGQVKQPYAPGPASAPAPTPSQTE
ncbi:MAG TPA: CDP-alcohol phosphatidyltransferase family protein [Anaerolineae bacterium]|nr:CDP-alcohol phosphatidyltransferase family protein [Anaerolineae bacterium]